MSITKKMVTDLKLQAREESTANVNSLIDLYRSYGGKESSVQFFDAFEYLIGLNDTQVKNSAICLFAEILYSYGIGMGYARVLKAGGFQE